MLSMEFLLPYYVETPLSNRTLYFLKPMKLGSRLDFSVILQLVQLPSFTGVFIIPFHRWVVVLNWILFFGPKPALLT